MNDLERLKRAEEAEPMAVAIVGLIPDCCGECRFCFPAVVNAYEEIYRCYLTGEDAPPTILEDCPLRKAIGIIEPNGHVVYLRDEEE